MSWKATSWAKDVLTCPNGQKITRSEKLLLMVMADQHTTHQEMVFVSQKNLSIESILSVRHLRRTLDSLEKKGVIKTETGLGRGNLSGYSFPQLRKIKEDMASPFSEDKSGHLNTEKRTFEHGKEDIPRHTLSKEVEQESETREVEYIAKSNSASSPVGGTPFYDFKTARSLYPRHRWNEKKARIAWDEIHPNQNEANKIVACLSDLVVSRRWTQDHGEHVPWASTFFSGRQWNVEDFIQRNHRSECEQMLASFIEISGVDPVFHKLTDGRYIMLSKRWDDALEKASGHTPENAMKMIRGAITAYCENHDAKKFKSLMSPEKIFESTETFERWIAEACRED